MHTFIRMKLLGCAEIFILLKKVGFGNSVSLFFQGKVKLKLGGPSPGLTTFADFETPANFKP